MECTFLKRFALGAAWGLPVGLGCSAMVWFSLGCLAYPERKLVLAEGWAAWVQAIGSVGAILVAIAVPTVIHIVGRVQAAKVRQSQARSLRILSYPLLRAAAQRADALAIDLENQFDDARARHDLVDAVWLNRFARNGSIDIPMSVSEMIDRLHLLDDAQCIAFQNAISLCATYNAMFSAQVAYGVERMDPEVLIGPAREAAAALNAAADALADFRA